MQSVYDVILNGASFGTRAAPGDGFIDPKSSYRYMDESATAPTNVEKSLSKARANRRYKNVIMQIHNMTNAYVDTMGASGGDANSPLGALSLRLIIEHGDSSLQTEDENNPGQHLRGADAIKRCIARAYCISEKRNIESYNPTETTYSQNGTSKKGSYGVASNIADIGPLADNLASAEAAITVTKVS
jgi:hypothetical protein